MNHKNSAAIVAINPDLFNISHFECGNGWFKILKILFTSIRSAPIKIDCVKEKFGGLRVYYSNNTDTELAYVDDAIREAEVASLHTCEMCGKPGSLSTKRYWIKTLCVECDN